MLAHRKTGLHHVICIYDSISYLSLGKLYFWVMIYPITNNKLYPPWMFIKTFKDIIDRLPSAESAGRMHSVGGNTGGFGGDGHRKIGGSSAQLGGNSGFKHKIRSESIGSIQRNGSIGTILTHDGSLCSTPYRESNPRCLSLF